jgi:hypothetical protein
VTPDGATRLVSLDNPDARPIRNALGRPVEFACKAQVVDNADGIVLDWQLEKGGSTHPTHPTWHPPSNATLATTSSGESS